MKPYSQNNISHDTFVRIFDSNIDPKHLQWHYDESDRVISVIENNGWKIQFDNQLPVLLEGTINIPKHLCHRVIKGNGVLKIQITET